MGDEPGTRWKRSFEDYAAARAAEAAQSVVEPPNFKPTCLDCAYDLTGLDDGLCPECGHAFTRKRLVAAYQARRKQREDRLKYWWHLPLGIAYVPLLASFGIDDYLSFAINASVFVLAALFWYVVNRDRFIEGAHWLLALQIPLLGMGLGAATLEHGVYAVIGVVVVMSLLSVVALRGSPLTSSYILSLGGVIPITGAAILLLIDSIEELALGHYWSYIDYPSFPRWRAFTAANACALGLSLLGFAVVMGIGMASVAKRARLRARRRAELDAARAASS